MFPSEQIHISSGFHNNYYKMSSNKVELSTVDNNMEYIIGSNEIDCFN